MDHMNQEPLDLPAALALLREARAEVARLRSAENALDAKRYYWSQGIEPWSLGAAPTPLQFPERGDAVNLARNWLDEQGPNPSGYVLESVAYDITNKGIRILAEAVMLMDAWILEVTKQLSAELPNAAPPTDQESWLIERFINDRTFSGIPAHCLIASAAFRDSRASEAVQAKVEIEALALLREINDALVLPSALQERVDKILDQQEEKP